MTGGLAEHAGKSGRQGARALAIATVVAQACALGRYMFLARMLGPVDLGLAAILILVINFFDQVADGGADRFLIQNRDADSPAALRLLHQFSLWRGFLIAAALVIFAQPLASLFASQQLVWGFVALASYPAIFGFRHLDYRRFQRRQDFRAESSVIMTSEIAGLIGTVAGVLILQNFTAIVVGLALRALVTVILSHRKAEWKYSAGNSPDHFHALRRFALPLMLNGLVVFAATQGDRMLIANIAGIAELGIYSAVFLLMSNPLNMVQRWIGSIWFPVITAAQDDPAAFRKVIGQLGDSALVLSIAAMWGFALIGAPATTLIFGSEFAMSSWLICLIAIYQAPRLLRVWPTNASLGLGLSKQVLTGNVVRMLAIPLAFLLAQWTDPLAGIIIAFTAGEMIALVVTIILLNRLEARPVAGWARRMGALLLASFAVLLVQRGMVQHDLLAGAGGLLAGVITFALIRQPALDMLKLGVAVASRSLGKAA